MIQLAIDPATRFLGYSIMDTSKTIGYDIVKYGVLRLDGSMETTNKERGQPEDL
jgi:Holliday junction resolvasome RuvABC endonuclease subunit